MDKPKAHVSPVVVEKERSMMKTVLVLGAGLVARPLVRYLLEKQGVAVTMASRTVSKAEAIVDGHPDGTCCALDLTAPAGLDDLIKSSDVVISLLPYRWHVDVAKRCIQFKRHLITTSYVKDEMQDLDQAAREAGVLLLNELGLDPGIDHMSAMRIIHAVQERGGEIASFRSYCGGLPAPEDDDNPLGYKFSWSPKGVVLAGTNNGRFLEDGELKEIPNSQLFATHWPVFVPGVGELEGYPNRDSVQYIEMYGLHGIKTMFRGTLRNLGWCATWQRLVELGLLDTSPRADLGSMTFAELLSGVAERQSGEELRTAVARHLSLHPDSREMRNIAWLGLLDEKPLPEKAESVADALTILLDEAMPYRAGEKDMIVLLHEFRASTPEVTELQRITSTLVAFGEPEGDSAMARTVSLPAAVAAHHLITGKITLTGVHIPTHKDVYNPVLDELANLGIECVEDWEA
jgi:saccharopine dehydrogenase-like NADP-dependent oxidoreductase